MKGAVPALALLSLLLAVAAAEPVAPPPVAPPPAAATPAALHAPGEHMELSILYQGLPIGRGRIQVEAPSGAVQPVRLGARTTGVVSVVKLRQLLTTYIDLGSGLPRTSSIDSVEGGYRHTTTADYDRERNRVVVVERGKSVHRHELEVPADTLDFLALVFRLRTLPLPPGGRHEFHVLAGRGVSRIVAEVIGRERVTTDAGSFDTVRVRVPTNFKGQFSEQKPTYVWLTDDSRRVVVRISVELGVGRIAAELASYDPGSLAEVR